MKMFRGESPSEMSIQVLTQFAIVLALKVDNRSCIRNAERTAINFEDQKEVIGPPEPGKFTRANEWLVSVHLILGGGRR
jgi:hypothetical protein